ncbi:BspA family leucine-rich repeat surface protein [Enterococcus casseliflavus]|nr:BspA family leucine-rich repeat surface protein [Enterococcus casseliflavus]
MLYKFSSILVVGMMVLGQPITVFANTIDSELQTNNSVIEDHEEMAEALEDSSESTFDTTEENVVDSGSTVDSTFEESTLSYSTNNETDSSEESNNSDEVEKKEETLVEDIVAGTWGSVPWEWNRETATITLQGGNAGTVATAPWKTYSDAVMKVRLNGIVVLPANSSQLFSATVGRLPNLKTIENSQYFDTSNVTNMTAMFQNLRTLQSLDVSTWDTSNVTNMFGLFDGLSIITELDVSNWDVSNVTTMSQLFRNDAQIQKLDLSNWNTRNVEIMSVMFFRMTNLRELVIGPDTVFLLGQTSLPSIPARNGYTGYWIRILDSDGNVPDEKNRFTSNELTGNNESPLPGTYVWERLESQPVTVRYIDLEGNELTDSLLIEGELGVPYETRAKEIPGWSVVETPDNASGAFTEDPQEVVYVYDRSDAGPVTVKHKNSEGNQLADPVILSGKVGLPYASAAKEIPGWYVAETPDNASGIFSEDPQEVVYIYNRSDASPVTVKHKDSEGNQLADPVILSGKVGLPYASAAKEIPGWYVAETPGNASGIFSEDPQEVVYIYNRSDASPVTVKHKDSEGNQLADPVILSGKVGLPYASAAKEIPGCHVTAIPDNSSGIFTEEPQEIVYIYAINKIDSDQDNSDNNLSTDNNFSDSNKRLPDTGESLIGQLSMILAGLLIVIGIFVFLIRRRKNNKD